MKYLKSIFLVILFVQSSFSQHFAKYAGEFLSIGVGSRAQGLGGAYVALANDASAGYWNPAALMRVNCPEVMLMHDGRFGGMSNTEFGAVAIPYGENSVLGLSIMRVGVDGIPDTRNAWEDRNNNGLFDSGDYINPDKVAYYNSADWAVYFSYAQRSESGLMYGINLKLLRRSIMEFGANGIGFDVGVLYSPSERWSLGLNAQDITSTLVAWSTGNNELISPTIKIGTAYSLDFFKGLLTPTFDVDMRFENRRFASIANVGPISLDPHFGLEYDFKKIIDVRVGYNDVKQYTLGAGIHLLKLDIDYAVAINQITFDDLSDGKNTHRISLRFIFQKDPAPQVSK